LGNINLIISPSEFLRRFLKSKGTRNRIEVIPNFVTPKEPAKIQEKDFFLFAGMLEETKGIRMLLRAFSKVKKQLIIAGTGSLSRFVTGYIREHNMQNVKYVGFLHTDRLFAYYRAADALIVPSTCEENNPMNILEALSVGTPVVASNRGGIPEIIQKIGKDLLFSGTASLISKIRAFDKHDYPKEKIQAIHRKYYSGEAYVKRYLELECLRE